jgi:hypothetical protein
MKKILLLLVAGIIILVSCSKIKTYRGLPPTEGQHTTDSIAALRAWVEQIAKEKTDSMHMADSLAAIGHTVDTSTLFGKKYLLIAVVEVNDHYFQNVNCYVDQNGKPVFDLAFPFSANINLDPSTGKAYVYYNPEHQAMLRNGTFRKVQAAGIKVGLSILGNGDPAGWTNFANLADATAFAQLVAIEVRRNGFSAVMTDDEYSAPPLVTPDPNSYVMVMSEIKRLLPDIFLCYYDLGSGSGTYKGKQMGDIADTHFPPSYPEYAYNVDNFPNSKTFISCQDGAIYDPSWVPNLKSEGRRGIMNYNLSGSIGAAVGFGSSVSTLKGVTLTVAPGCLNPNQVDFVNGQ